MSAEIKVPISPGELIDKITILEIKSAHITDAAKLANVAVELQLLQETWRTSASCDARHRRRMGALRDDQQEALGHRRRHPRQGAARKFDQEFIELARAVYITNDERAAVKETINTKLGSKIVEEKSYAKY